MCRTARLNIQSITLDLLNEALVAVLDLSTTMTVTEWLVVPAGLQVYSPSSSSSTLLTTILLRLELSLLSSSRRTPPLWSLKSRGRPRMYLRQIQYKTVKKTVEKWFGLEIYIPSKNHKTEIE